jgi:hypothetical protein
MNVTAEHVAAVRALVTEDDDAFDQLTDGAGPEWLYDFASLVAAVFFAGTQFRFVDAESRPDIIQFVARSRIRHGGDDAGFSPGLGEALMGAAVGINPVPSGLEEAENSAAQVALLKDLAGELSFHDFELLLATARSELNRMYPQADAEAENARQDFAPARARAAGVLNPADVLAAVERVRAQSDATASRVNALEAEVRSLQARLESSLAAGR